MKFVHLSDLHLGKNVNGFSMMEDQKYILRRIVNVIDEEKPDGVILAGDVYDKSIPSVEAVKLFDDFLNRLAKKNLQVFVISGNHDSPERLAFASGLIEKSGIHIAGGYDGKVQAVSLSDDYGKVNVYMLPFIKPVQVHALFPEEDIKTYTDAVGAAVSRININEKERNIIIAHQFVIGAECSGSEEISVGGTEHVESSVFAGFDYVALGHIHKPQAVGKESIRYCGTPLKYSFSEVKHRKSVTVLQLEEKGKLDVKTVDLIPKHDLRELRGSYEELSNKKNYEGTAVDDYLHITLTDEEDVFEAISKLRVIYPNLMLLDYDNERTRGNNLVTGGPEMENKPPLELLQDFYEQQNNQPMNEEQTAFSTALIERIWG